MPNSLDDFKKKLTNSPALKAMLIGDALNTLQKHGVDINDPAVVAKLGLDKPFDFGKFNPAASTNIITIAS